MSHVTRTPLSGSTVKGQGHQAALVGCSSHYIMYIDENSMPPLRVSRCLSIMNIHGTKRIGRRRRKACRLWTRRRRRGPQRA